MDNLPRFYPMTQDVYGERSYQQQLDSMAKMVVDIVIGYRLDYDDFRKLLDYAEANHNRLNR